MLRMYQNPRGWAPPGWVNDQATTAYLAAQLDALNQQIQPQNTAATRKQNVEQLCKAKAEAIFKKYGWSDVMTIAEIIEFLAWAVGSSLLNCVDPWRSGVGGHIRRCGTTDRPTSVLAPPHSRVRHLRVRVQSQHEVPKHLPFKVKKTKQQQPYNETITSVAGQIGMPTWLIEQDWLEAYEIEGMNSGRWLFRFRTFNTVSKNPQHPRCTNTCPKGSCPQRLTVEAVPGP